METRAINPHGKKKVDLSKKTCCVKFRTWCVQQVGLGKKTPGQLAKFYNLPRTTIAGWVDRSKGGSAMHEKRGRPKKISDAALEKVTKFLDEATYDLRTQEFHTLLQEAAVKSAEERGMGTLDVSVSKNTIRRVSKAIGVETGKAEATTTARIRACGEVRNQVSLAAMMESQGALNQHLDKRPKDSHPTVGESHLNPPLVCYKHYKAHLDGQPDFNSLAQRNTA
jgi:ribosomal protein S15P/S13E